uniref:Uncharacterized protein n=1 Tax=Arion vulgaris TaxID=1028688 RepID=A0A0B7BHZ2_9EUPU
MYFRDAAVITSSKHASFTTSGLSLLPDHAVTIAVLSAVQCRYNTPISRVNNQLNVHHT